MATDPKTTQQDIDPALDPNTSPDELGKVKAGTRRVNNRPLLLAGTGLMLFAGMIGFVASQRGQTPEDAGKATGDTAKSSMMAAQEIIGDHKTGVIVERKPAPPVLPTLPTAPPASATPELTQNQTPQNAPAPIAVERPLDPEAPPPPPREEGNGDDAMSQAEQSLAQVKLQQFQEAMKAHSNVSVSMPRSEGSRPSTDQVASNDGTQGKLAALRRKMEADASDDDDNDDARKTNQSDNDKRNNLAKYDANDRHNRWKIDSKVEKPESRYMLRTGFVMPATLITGVNSELPGQLSAQVSQNVYDTATGRYLLIPQGSRLVGEYNSQIAYGQKRVLVAWQRVIFPDGKALDIGAMPGTDFAGYSGMKDQVDNHFLRVFGSALLMSAITAGVNYSQNQAQGNSNGYNMNSSSVLSQSLGEGMGEAMQQLFQRDLNIAPTLKIRPGYRLNVMVNKDLVFSKPYSNFDY